LFAETAARFAAVLPFYSAPASTPVRTKLHSIQSNLVFQAVDARRLSLIVLLLPIQALAASSVPSSAGSIVQMLFGLGITLALLFGGLVVLKRLQASRVSQPGTLRVISAIPVGPRERVVLVAVGKQVLVVGVAPGRVSALHTMQLEDLPPTPEPASPLKNPLSGEFAKRLKNILEHHREN
jgi:flagellar protein FliO/FliZ